MAKKPIFSKSSIPRPQMEVYTSGHAKSWIWNALPGPVASLYSLVIAGSVTGLAYFFGDRYANGSGYTWSLIAIGVMTVIGLIAGGFRAARAKKEANEGGDEGFGDALKASASGWDSGASDPAEIARLDDLRKNFQKGIDTFTEYGKDLYALPWYVIMGEPGSGKTEAIRRSELRFPEALQDKLQGTGGTYSMHWWFTNQAIIIDTAGAMLLQPEASGRFEEFLALLRSHRKDCPINGLILTIPVDSLLSDSPPAAEQKAKMIAIQLGIIQKALDVRFPIYVMISKSDRLPGFREYFDADGQSAFERQMIGWSNPDPLGTPFEPERIYEAVDTIANRLQSRALALLAEPIPPNPASRRLDEVDSVYNFPQVIRTLAPRLRLYLDVIFQTGTWATKPPFFRGIYFTSALREGAQLDLQLAQALGLPLQQLPPGGIFSREKAVFLRDVFIEKIFMERGLVTRLVDIGAHLRKRLMTFYGVTATLLLLAIGFAWFVKTRLRDQLDQEQTLWSAANAGWDNGAILPLIKRETSSNLIPGTEQKPVFVPRWTWRDGENDVAMVKDNKRFSRLSLLEEMSHRVNGSLSFSWVFSPISEWRDFLNRRRQGYVTVFEGSVMKPLLDGVRERILWDTASGSKTGGDSQQKLAKAYEQLLKIELWLGDNKAYRPSVEDWKTLFSALLEYVCDPLLPGGIADKESQRGVPPKSKFSTNDADVERLAALAGQIFGSTVDFQRRSWMSELSQDEQIRALSKGSELLLGISSQVEVNKEEEARRQEQLVSACRSFLAAEDQLDAIQTNKEQAPLTRIEGLIKQLEDSAVKIGASSGSMGASDAAARFQSSIVAIDEIAGALSERDAFFARLQRQASDIRTGRNATPATNAFPADLNAGVLTNNSYATRLGLYREAFGYGSVLGGGLAPRNMLGKLGEIINSAMLQPSVTAVAPVDVKTAPEAKTGVYSGPRADVCLRIAQQLLPAYRQSISLDSQLGNYYREVVGRLPYILKFPLAINSSEFSDQGELIERCRELAKMSKDFDDFDRMESSLKPTQGKAMLSELGGKLKPVFAVARSLYDESLQDLKKVTVSPSKPQAYDEQPQPPVQAASPIGLPPSMVQLPPKIIPGLKKLVIETSDGDYITQTPNSVSAKDVPCHLGIKISAVHSSGLDQAEPRQLPDRYSTRWGILRLIYDKGRVYKFENMISVSFEFKPALPERWPQASTFSQELLEAQGKTTPR